MAAVSLCLAVGIAVLPCSEAPAAGLPSEGARSAAGFVFEPTAGAWYGGSDKARWQGAFAELTTWRNELERAKGFTFGLDVIGTYSTGSRINTAYKWNEERIGAGPAIQYSDYSVVRPWQWQLKTRLQYEHADGDNRKDGYWQRQQTVSLNAYTEWLTRVAPAWISGLTAEGGLMLTASKSSTVAHGDEISDRNLCIANAFIQYKLSREIQGRIFVVGLYQGWDNKFGEEFAAEFRFNETVMCGLQGGLIGDSKVITVFARIELGKPLRHITGP